MCTGGANAAHSCCLDKTDPGRRMGILIGVPNVPNKTNKVNGKAELLGFTYPSDATTTVNPKGAKILEDLFEALKGVLE